MSITQGGTEGKSKVVTSCSYLEEKFLDCSKREGVGLATSVGTSGVDLRSAIKQVSANEKEKVRREILICLAKSSLPDKLHEDCAERSSRWHRTCRNIEVEEADDSSRRQEGVGLARCLFSWR